MKIKDIPSDLRPREKAMSMGLSSLSDRELLALIIRKGYSGISALELADQILFVAKNLAGICRLSFEDLIQIKGIKEVKALEVLALAEVASRIVQPQKGVYININNPKCLVEWFNMEIGYDYQEHFVAVYLDTQNRLIGHEFLFKGTLDRSIVHPREVFKVAVKLSAARIILVHNHPSGSLRASNNDIKTTQALIEIGDMIGIYVVDHLIVSEGNFLSLRQSMTQLFGID